MDERTLLSDRARAGENTRIALWDGIGVLVRADLVSRCGGVVRHAAC